MAILLTGASGFVGKHLVSTLLRSNQSVFALVRNVKQFEQTIAVLSKRYKDQLVVIDSLERLRSKDVKRIDSVIHAAAQSNNAANDWTDLYVSNVQFTNHLVDWASLNNIGLFVYFSSLSVHGVPEEFEITKDTKPNPSNLYGLSKWLGELSVKKFENFGTTCTLRLPAVVGKGARYHWLANYLNSALTGRPFVICNPEAKFNNLIDVETLGHLIKHLLQTPPKDCIALPVGSSGFVTISEIVDLVTNFQLPSHETRISQFITKSFTVNTSEMIRYLNYRPEETRTTIKRYIYDSFKTTGG
ncbi:MAG: NAD(P)-dependent oxidoreductase [Pseudomonadota bacterium]|nr:NAD(P)-dependent oxidoreductase [Pseudomonadota bacterium]